MSDNLQRQAEEIFHQASELPLIERSVFLDARCGDDSALRSEVQSLLDAFGNAKSFMRSPAIVEAGAVPPGAGEPSDVRSSDAPGATSDVFATDASKTGALAGLKPGDMVGPYKLRELIGEGGFGLVFLAEQERPIRRRVALKIIKIGLDTREVVARFEGERQALAMMHHPNVARVLDAGATDTGRPYFVMEHVPGTAITDYCDRHRLDTRERLAIFIDVCDAIQHAHQVGIIHRDLKPSNVLVMVLDGKAVPKVIDFGIAKAIGQRLTEKTVFTQQGQLIGTPEYTSPEQAEMTGLGVDTRTDIYSLGVLLYELLVGRLPFDPETLRAQGFGELQRIIREDEPPRLSKRLDSLGGEAQTVAEKRRADAPSLSRQLRGDLDWITMKAMEKDRTRRYATASELAADIRRHLRDEPVLAGPPSARYRLKKFARRHRVAVAAGAAVALSLVVGIIGTATMAYDAMRQREVAAKQARIATAISDFLQDMLKAPDPWSQDPTGGVAREIKVVDALDRAAAKLDTAFPDDPQVEAAVRSTLGHTYVNLGAWEKAETQLARVLELYRREHDEDQGRLVELLVDLADLLRDRGKLIQAQARISEAIKIANAQFGPRHERTLRAQVGLGTLRYVQGDPAKAESIAQSAFDTAEESLGIDHDVTIAAKSLLAFSWDAQWKLSEALDAYRDVYGVLLAKHGVEHRDTLDAMNNYAITLKQMGRLAEAEPLYLKQLETCRRILPQHHRDTMIAMNNLAALYKKQGRFSEAEPLYLAAIEGFSATLGPDHLQTLGAMNNLASLHKAQGEPAAALREYGEVLEAQRRALSDDHPDTLITMNNLAMTLVALDRPEEAEPLFAELVEKAMRVLPSEENGTIADYRWNYAVCLIDLERYAAAETHLVAVYTVMRKMRTNADGSEHHTVGKVRADLVRLYEAWGKSEKAEQFLRPPISADRPGT